MSADIQKSVTIALLLDDYGELLTPHQREIISMYYAEDLSLGEIAQLCGITRQGVRDAIKKAEATLLSYEEKLGIRQKMTVLQNELLAIAASLRRTPTDAEAVLHAADRLTSLLS